MKDFLNQLKRRFKRSFESMRLIDWIFPLCILIICTISWIISTIVQNQLNLTNLADSSVLNGLGLLKDNPNQWNYLTQNGELYRYITYSLVHSSFNHYFLNMVSLLMLWFFLLETKTKGIELIYLVTTILGGMAQLHFTKSIDATVIGASGGIMGITGLWAANFLLDRSWYIFFLFIISSVVAELPAMLGRSNAGWIAHVAGLIIGLVYGLIQSKIRNRE